MTKETSIADDFIKGVQERERLERERLRELGEKIEKLAAEHKIFRLTEIRERSWYDDVWAETVTDWTAVARLFEGLKLEIDTK